VVEDVLTTNLGSSQVFQRYNAEARRGSRGSFLYPEPRRAGSTSQAPGRPGLPLAELPAAARLRRPDPPDTFSSDAIIMMYNKILLPPRNARVAWPIYPLAQRTRPASNTG